MAALCGFCWSILAIGLKVALDFASSGTIVWFRMFLATLVLAGLLGFRNWQNLRILWRPPLLALIAGLGLSTNYIGYMKGIEYTSPSNAQIFIQLAPLLLIVVGIVWFQERPTRLQIAGFFLTLVGFVIFYRDQLGLAVDDFARFRLGNIWILIAALTWVVFAALQKVLLRDWTPAQINLFIYVLASVLLAPICDFQQFAPMSAWQWALMIGLALNTVIAYGALGVALQKAPATQVSIILTLNPLITLTLMFLFHLLHVTWIRPDPISLQGWLGAMIVVAGVILVIRKR